MRNKSIQFRLIFAAVTLLCTGSGTAAEKLPLMPDGKPDLQGIWTSGTLTSYERPPQVGGRTHLTAAEVAEQQAAATERYWAAGHRQGEVGRDNDAFLDNDMTLLASGQTSLVVLPHDGRYPLAAEAERRRDYNLTSMDSYETMSQWDRCITREPTALFPVNYNNAVQIVQTADHVVIVAEMIHDARVIPLRGAHPNSNVRSWGGDSRGHWEGATLVVDTTNFNDGGWIATGSTAGRLRGVPYSKNLHLIERFTRADAKTLNYEITIEDPQMYTSPWQLALPLQRDDAYRMYEYACHEGNSAIEAMLQGARAVEGRIGN
jgi:hypothetical protein